MQLTATNPGNIELTLTLALRLDQWKKVREDLERGSSPTWIADEVANIIRQAEAVFYPRGTG